MTWQKFINPIERIKGEGEGTIKIVPTFGVKMMICVSVVPKMMKQDSRA